MQRESFKAKKLFCKIFTRIRKRCFNQISRNVERYHSSEVYTELIHISTIGEHSSPSKGTWYGKINKTSKGTWYGKIDKTISELQDDLFRIRSNLRLPLIKQERDMNINISEINQSILDIKHLLQSNEVCQMSACRTKIAKFRKMAS